MPHPCSEEKAITSMPDNSTDVAIIVGVDTHKDIHVAVAIDTLGRRQGQLAVCATAAGYQQLHRWALDLGPNQGFGVEGTGSYGAGLARYLHNRGAHVIEVNRPDRDLSTHLSRAGRRPRSHPTRWRRARISGQCSSHARSG